MLASVIPVFGLDESRDLENRRLAFIKEALSEKEIAYEERSLFTSQGGFGSSIHVVYSSTEADTGTGQFVLAVPLSTLNDTQDIARFDITAALNIAERLKDRPINARIAFLGDEYSSLPEDVSGIRNIGLADLVSLCDTPENVIICYFDLPFTPGALTIHHGSSGVVAPLSVLEPLTDAFEECSIPYSLSINYNELYKLRLIQSQKPLDIIQAAAFPSLLVKGKQTASNSISAELCGESFADYVSGIDISSENYDTHYSFINIFNKTIYFSEIVTVFVFLAVGIVSLILLFVYSLTHRYILSVQWKVFSKRSWIVLLHFLLLTGSLFISGQIYFLIRRIIHIPDLQADYISILMRIFIALCFYNLFVPVFYRIWIPRKDLFYGNAAVTLAVIGTIIAAFIDITFVPLFLWSFIFTILGTVFTNPWAALLCLTAIPLQLCGALINIISSGSPALAILIMSNNINTTLFIACIALPEILMANRVILLFRRSRSDRELKSRTIRQLSVIGVTVVLFAVLGIVMANQAQPLPFRKTVTEAEHSPGQVLHANLTSTEYLDRRVLALSMDALGNPAKFNVSISNVNQNTPFVIYDAPTPFERLNEDNTALFRLGERPDNPFEMEIVLPAELQCTVLLEAVYSSWDSAVDPEKPENTEDYAAAYRLSLSIPE